MTSHKQPLENTGESGALPASQARAASLRPQPATRSSQSGIANAATPDAFQRVTNRICAYLQLGEPDYADLTDQQAEILGFLLDEFCPVVRALEKLTAKADACDPKYEDAPGELHRLVNVAYAVMAHVRGETA